MQHSWKELGSFGTVGLELALSVLFGLFAGRWIDRKLDTANWFTFLGLGFGIAAGCRAVGRGAPGQHGHPGDGRVDALCRYTWTRLLGVRPCHPGRS